MTFILKTNFSNGVFGEFLLQSNKADVVILLSGFPSNNVYDDEMSFFHDAGFHVFFLRYPGMYQSKGVFIEDGLVSPLVKSIDEIRSGSITNLWDDKIVNFEYSRIHIITGSFGGAVALGIADRSDIASLVLFSPVLDFSLHNSLGDEQDLSHMDSFTRKAYANCIRMPVENIVPLLSSAKELSGLPKIASNVLIFHDPSDTVVSVSKSESYVNSLTSGNINLGYKGHGLKLPLLLPFKKEIIDFLMR